MRKLTPSLVALLLLVITGALLASCAGESSDPPSVDARATADARTGGAIDAAPPTADAATADAAP